VSHDSGANLFYHDKTVKIAKPKQLKILIDKSAGALCLGLGYHDVTVTVFANGLNITARQYGEVVLPDDSTGQVPGTPRQRGHETVTVQGGYGALFAVQVQVL